MNKDLQQLMLKAAKNGDETVLKNKLLMFNSFDWIKSNNENADNLLHIAVRFEHIHIVRLLINDAGGKNFINYSNKTGKTPLHEAAQINSPELIDYLISQGAEPDALTRSSWTALMLAASKNGIRALKSVMCLIRYNANPNMQNKDGWTVLHIACRTGDDEIVKLLLDKFPFLVSITSKNGRYPIHTAALHGHLHIVKMLLKVDPDLHSVLDSCGTLPIHDASRSNNCEIVDLLVGEGACINQCDSMGLNCLHMAAQAGAIAVIKFLLRKWKMDVNDVNKINKFTALHYAAQAGQCDAIRQLLNNDADPQRKDSEGRTSLELTYGIQREHYLKIIQRYKLK